ncbi:MAG: iron export ABC transporter permease subunit FetB [SAR324 cluster bacterium]|nr:iron export ABC transporter permease subunit FetB [SAR324 cluster bacterium]
MTSDYIAMGPWQLAFAAALILINLIFSMMLKLQLEKMLWVASLRMVSQLLLLGYVLEWIFALQNFVMILGLALMMATVASVSAVSRTRRRFGTIYLSSFMSVAVSSCFITSIALAGIVQIEPWYHPQYFFPLLGMVLGNTLNGISLALDRFMEDLSARQNQIESLLAIGATRWEAAHDSVKEAARTGMIPIINSMMVMGIVSLPGMMTGQILAGALPLDAVYYQIVIVFMIASASALGVILIILMAFHCLLNTRHQLCTARLHTKPSGKRK